MSKIDTLDRLAGDTAELLGPGFRVTIDDSMAVASHLPSGDWPGPGVGVASVSDWTPKIDYRRSYDAQIARDLAEVFRVKFRRAARDPRYTAIARAQAADAVAALSI